MDNQQKYLLTGFAGAIAIVVLVNMFAVYGNSSAFWLMLLATIASAMVLLVVNIYLSTKIIAVRSEDGSGSVSHKKA